MDKNWQHEKMALNRNVFNNQRRNLNRIQEEQKENLNDEGQESSQLSMRDLSDSSPVVKGLYYEGDYLQQLYVNQMRSRQQPISNVHGDKGNETINDVDEEEENHRRIDYFDNIDMIDVNIEENFS